MSSVEDLVFSKEYEEACAASDLGDARMNYMVRRYDAALNYWSARGRYAEIELGKERSKHTEWKAFYKRKSVEFKRTSETAILEKNRAIARITADRKRIEDLELKLKGAQVVPGMEADAPSELESAWAEVAELKRQIVVKDREITRLQKAWSHDVTIRDWNVRQKANDEKLLLHAQALEPRKCLEKIRGKRGVCVPPEIVDIFSKREATFEKEFGELKVGEIPDTDLSFLRFAGSSSSTPSTSAGLRDPTDGGASPVGGSRIAMPREQGTGCTTRPGEVEGEIRKSGAGDAPDQAGGNVTNTREDESIDDMRSGVAGCTRRRGLMAEVLARQRFSTRPKVVPRGLRLARPYPRTIRGSGSSFC
ncbi:hypothetical protein Bca101_096426 [Brassica carinata]